MKKKNNKGKVKRFEMVVLNNSKAQYSVNVTIPTFFVVVLTTANDELLNCIIKI